MTEIWEKKKQGVIEKLNAQGILVDINLKKIKGGGTGHPSRYFLKISLISKSNDSAKKRVIPTDGVEYFTEEIASNRITEFLSKGFQLAGWGAAAFIGALVSISVIIGVILLIVLLVLLYSEPSYQMVVTSMLALVLWTFIGSYCIKPFRELLNNKITIAPVWLQPMNSDDRVLEFLRDESEQANAIYLKQYSANCPLCDAKVRVSSGRREFNGRLVGRCATSPNEHVYSFDHILRIGKPLR